MEPKLILRSLRTYQKEEGDSEFLGETISYFKSLREPIVEISDNPYLLAGVRLTLFYNLDRYHFEISNRKQRNFIMYRKFTLKEDVSRKLFLQLEAIVENSVELCKRDEDVYFKTVYFGVVEGPEENPYFYEIDSMFLSLQSFYFLEHQNLERYCQLEKSGKSKVVLDEFSLLKRKIEDLDWRVKDRLFIYSGGVFQFLGVIYSEDIDLIYVSKDESYDDVDGFEEFFDLHIVTPKRVIEVCDEKAGKKTLAYKDALYRSTIARYVGVNNIYEMILDPNHYFHFIGVKCIDLFSSIYRNNARSNAFTMIDLVLMKEFVNIDMIDKFCVKNIVIRRGHIQINNDKRMEALYRKASKYMKIWYDRDIKPEYFQKRFKRCQNIYFFTGDKPSLEIENIFKYNRFVLRSVLERYPKGKLLDIGIGRCSSLTDYYWKNYSIIVGIEPSLESLDICKQKIEKYGNTNVFLYPGKGEDEWDSEVYQNKYNLVVMNFTIHYTLDKLDDLIDNICRVTKKGSVVAINFLDGDKIRKKMKGKDGYKIMWKDDLQWGAFPFDGETLIYMNGAYGVVNGSVEKLASKKKIIRGFVENGFTVIGDKSYLDFMGQSKKWPHLIKHKFQKEIISLHHNLLLVKK